MKNLHKIKRAREEILDNYILASIWDHHNVANKFFIDTKTGSISYEDNISLAVEECMTKSNYDDEIGHIADWEAEGRPNLSEQVLIEYI